MRRAVALLVHLLMLQFLLLGSGDACVLPAVVRGMSVASTHATPGDDGAMTGMRMTGLRDAVHGGPTDPASCGTPRDHSGGSVPHAPAGCQTLAPCAAVALGAANPTAVERAPARATVGRTAFVVRQLASRPTAPEPPPPRA